MRSNGLAARLGFGLTLLVLLPAAAAAQSAIAGTVRDTSGAVMPGVTVEAASPALIEKVRTVTTDSAGQYRIVDLRPGVYTVTFTLPGFNVVKREGIELPSNFTASVNAELRIGAIEESVTVSGRSPVVDVQSAAQQQVLSRDLLDNVPTGRTLWGLGYQLPGVTLSAPDVGGVRGGQQTYMAVHGSNTRDNAMQIDGLEVNSLNQDGTWYNYNNSMMFEEVAFETAGLSAEFRSSGIRMNQIPKEGGNTFSGTIYFSDTPGDWSADNSTPELHARGLQAGSQPVRTYDINVGVGGPIQKDRIWFYGSYRHWLGDTTIANSFYNANPSRRTYQPDLDHQVIDENTIKNGTMRLTMRPGQTHKFALYMDRISKFRGHECPQLSAAEACGVRHPRNYYTGQVKYTGTPTSRVLIEGGFSVNSITWSSQELQPDLPSDAIPRRDLITGTRWSAPITPFQLQSGPRNTLSASASYVTGTHAFKGGMQYGFGTVHQLQSLQSLAGIDLVQEYRNGVPASVFVYNTPLDIRDRMDRDFSIFVQDAWTMKRLTLSPGIRFEWLKGRTPAQSAPAGRFIVARNFAEVDNMPNWNAIAPRVGVAYDLFGNAKTALKASAGKYMIAYSVGFSQTYNPMRQSTDRRTWTDRNGDDIAQNNEIGPSNNNLFGLAGDRRPDPDIEWPYQYEYTVGIQQELMRGLSVSASWVRRDFKKILFTDNLLISQSDYTPVPVTNPLNPAETIPVYNLNPAKRGQVQELDRNSDQRKRWYNGYDFGFTARVRGGSFFGGLSTGHQIMVNCEVDDPNLLRFCDQSAFGMPYRAQFKVSGTYPLWYGIRLSGTFVSNQGGSTTQNAGGTATTTRANRGDNSLNVDYLVNRTLIPNLTQTQVSVELIQPGTKYLPRWNQVDFRVAKLVKVGRVSFNPQFDFYNMLNANPILSQVETYGSSLDNVSSILQGRTLAFSVKTDF